MINAIRGRIVEVTESSIIVLTDSGVEYFIEISNKSASRFMSLKGEEKEKVRVLTVLQHREDAMLLYGFYDEKERFAFNELITVPGIAAKGALKILGGVSVDELALMLDQQDVKRLSKIPGLGAKTAQKLILQLRNVLVFDDGEKEGETSGEGSSSISTRFKDLITSFTDMGYDRRDVIKAVDTTLSESGSLYSALSDREIEKKIFTSVLRRLN